MGWDSADAARLAALSLVWNWVATRSPAPSPKWMLRLEKPPSTCCFDKFPIALRSATSKMLVASFPDINGRRVCGQVGGGASAATRSSGSDLPELVARRLSKRSSARFKVCRSTSFCSGRLLNSNPQPLAVLAARRADNGARVSPSCRRTASTPPHSSIRRRRQNGTRRVNSGSSQGLSCWRLRSLSRGTSWGRVQRTARSFFAGAVLSRFVFSRTWGTRNNKSHGGGVVLVPGSFRCWKMRSCVS